MAIYSIYIFDRHAECIYKRRWLPRSRAGSKDPSRSRGQSLSTIATANTANTDISKRGSGSNDDDSKLIFGTVFALRNMVRQVAGEEDDAFLSYETSHYKLHYYETPTNLKFVMLTDPKSPNMTLVLQRIYITLYVEYVVKNPLSPTEHPGGVGVNNELFELSLEHFVSQIQL